jgi:hypothetical protein
MFRGRWMGSGHGTDVSSVFNCYLQRCEVGTNSDAIFTNHFGKSVLFIHKAARTDCSRRLVMLVLLYHNCMLQKISPTLTHVLSPFSLFFEFEVKYKDSSLTYATPALKLILRESFRRRKKTGNFCSCF